MSAHSTITMRPGSSQPAAASSAFHPGFVFALRIPTVGVMLGERTVGLLPEDAAAATAPEELVDVRSPPLDLRGHAQWPQRRDLVIYEVRRLLRTIPSDHAAAIDVEVLDEDDVRARRCGRRVLNQAELQRGAVGLEQPVPRSLAGSVQDEDRVLVIVPDQRGAADLEERRLVLLPHLQCPRLILCRVIGVVGIAWRTGRRGFADAVQLNVRPTLADEAGAIVKEVERRARGEDAFERRVVKRGR